MESVTAARKRDFANENYSDEEPNFSIIGQLFFEFEERTAIFEHDALINRVAAEHRALKWIQPQLKGAGIDPVFFNKIIGKEYEKIKSEEIISKVVSMVEKKAKEIEEKNQ